MQGTIWQSWSSCQMTLTAQSLACLLRWYPHRPSSVAVLL